VAASRGKSGAAIWQWRYAYGVARDAASDRGAPAAARWRRSAWRPASVAAHGSIARRGSGCRAREVANDRRLHGGDSAAWRRVYMANRQQRRGQTDRTDVVTICDLQKAARWRETLTRCPMRASRRWCERRSALRTIPTIPVALRSDVALCAARER
jgi:hypothetical protein